MKNLDVNLETIENIELEVLEITLKPIAIDIDERLFHDVKHSEFPS